MKPRSILRVLAAAVLLGGFVVLAIQAADESLREEYAETPNDPEIHTRMIARWMSMATGKQQAHVLEETAAALASNPPEGHRLDILFVRARAAILLPNQSPEKASSFVEDFIKAAPKDDRSAELLFRFARAQTTSATQTPIYERAVSKYPTSYWGIMSKGSLTQLAGMGKPFELDFSDAITGEPVSVQRDMHGKVVLVYFWATWCSDCAAELPMMKQLYDTYRSKGVEFVGVSLDEPESRGGLTNLKNYVARNSIPWPQYFQGGDKQLSVFSSSWGVSATPTVFILDKEGRLFAINPGDKLEQVITEALSKPAA